MVVIFGVVIWTLFLVTVAVVAIVLISVDRRRRWRRGDALSPSWSGPCATYAAVDVHIPIESFDRLAVDALWSCGITPEAHRPGVRWWIGFGGFSWRTWGQEYALTAQPLTAQSSRIWCCSRPRF